MACGVGVHVRCRTSWATHHAPCLRRRTGRASHAPVDCWCMRLVALLRRHDDDEALDDPLWKRLVSMELSR